MSTNPILNRELNTEPRTEEPAPRPLNLGKLAICLYMAALLAASIWNQGCGSAPSGIGSEAFAADGPGLACDVSNDACVADGAVTPVSLPDCDGIDCPLAYDVSFSIAARVPVGSAQFEIDYATAPGRFEGAGGGVLCRVSESVTALAAFQNCLGPDQEGCSRAKSLRAGLATTQAVATPSEFIVCTMLSSTRPPNPSDFRVEVIEASDNSAQPISPTPIVYVSGIRLR